MFGIAQRTVLAHAHAVSVARAADDELGAGTDLGCDGGTAVNQRCSEDRKDGQAEPDAVIG